MDEWMDRWTYFVVMTIVYVVFPFLWVSGLSDLAGTLVIASLHLLLVCSPDLVFMILFFPFLRCCPSVRETGAGMGNSLVSLGRLLFLFFPFVYFQGVHFFFSLAQWYVFSYYHSGPGQSSSGV